MVLNSWKLTIPILLTIDGLFAVELRRRLFVRSDTPQCQQWPDFHFCGVPGFLYCEGLIILLYPGMFRLTNFYCKCSTMVPTPTTKIGFTEGTSSFSCPGLSLHTDNRVIVATIICTILVGTCSSSIATR